MIKKLLFLILFLPLFSPAQTGMITYDTVISGRNFKVTMPDNWWTSANTEQTECIVWFHGMGEQGTDASKLNLYGPHYWINTQGTWDGKVTMGNGVHRPVIISFQRLSTDASGNMRPFALKPIIDMIKTRWRIKENAMYGIGFSQGAWVMNLGVTYKPTTTDFSYYTMFNAVVTIQGVVPTDTYGAAIPSPQRFGNVSGYTSMYRPRPFKMLGLEQINDSRNMHLYNKNMNDSVPGTGKFIWTNYGGLGHGEGVTAITNPANNNWTSSNTETQLTKSGNSYQSTWIEGGTNIYQWLLRQGDTTLGSTPPPVNQSPIVNVGVDVVITSPASSVSLTATASDPDGTIVSYLWTKVLGGNANIVSSASATTTISGLAVGSYTFRCLVTDDDGATAMDNVNVTVNAAGNSLPIVSAGTDQNITLPTNTATLTGSASDVDGTISSILWTQVAGPNTSTISTPTANSTGVTGLIQGTYSYRFAATDNSGETVADTMTLTVSAAQTGEEQSVFIQLYGGSNPYVNSQWNNWNTTASLTTTNLKFITGATSTIGASLSSQLSVSENTSPYVGTIVPTEVLRYASYTTAPRSLTLTGLNPGKQYTFILVASRKNTDNTTNFTIGGVTRGVYVNNNFTNAATFTDIAPSVSGEVTINIDRANTNGGNYLNAIKIIQQGSGTSTNEAPISNAGAEQFITLPQDTTELSGSGIDYDGVISSYSWSSISGPVLGTIDAPNSQITKVRGLTVAGDYVFELTVMDDDGAIGKDSVVIHVNDAGVTPIAISAGRDTTLALAQNNNPTTSYDVTQLTLRGNGTGSVTAWTWAKLSGGPVTIVSPTSQNTLVTGFQPGYYSFRLSGTNGVNTVYDTIIVRVVDYQKKGERPCREGAPVTHTLTKTNSTELVRTYLVRDGWNIMGGDTVKIPGGNYTGISLGDFGGMKACPVILVPSGSPVVVGNGNNSSFFRFGNSAADTNFVAHVRILGDYLPGIPYGFQHIDPTPESENATGMVFNLATDIEVSGVYVYGATTGIMSKLDSDSARPWRIHNNFRQKNMKFHDNFFTRINGEGFYIGHTSPNGDKTQQPANNGHTVRMDSLMIYRNVLDSCAWDMLQTSNAVYAEVYENIAIRGGTENQSSQRAAAIIGGNTQGKFVRNVIYNSKEGIGLYGYGNVEVAYNYIDSINAGSTTSDGIYASSNLSTVIEARDSLKINIHHNFFRRMERRAVFAANNSNRMGVGQIKFNTIYEPSRNLATMIGTNANDVISDNTIITSDPGIIIRRVNANTASPSIAVTKGGITQNFSNANGILQFLGVVEDTEEPPIDPNPPIMLPLKKFRNFIIQMVY